MKKIIVTEKISDKGVALLKAQKDLQVDVEMNLSREELLKRIPEYDAIIVRSVTKINEEFYEHATNLKVVGRAGNGVDNIQMEGATKRGIIVVNTPESNIVSAAEHTIGLMLSSCRNTVKAHKMIESRYGTDGKDPGHYRSGPHRRSGYHPHAGLWHEGHCLRSVHCGCPVQKIQC